MHTDARRQDALNASGGEHKISLGGAFTLQSHQICNIPILEVSFESSLALKSQFTLFNDILMSYFKE